MIQKLIIILFAILFAHTAASAQDWVQTNGPAGNGIKALTFNSKKDIFILSDILLRSTDKGTSWMQIGPQNGSAASIAIAPNDNIYITFYSNNGQDSSGIWESTDKGTSWNQLFSSQGLANIAVSNDGIIYVGGWSVHQFSYSLRSIDAGKSWDSAFVENQFSIMALAVSSKGTPIFCTDGNIFRSTDKGINWTKVINGLPGQEDYRWIACSKNGNIFVSGLSPYQSFLSTDDGRTWISLPMQEGPFASSPTGRVLFVNGQALFSDDNGSTWKNFGNPPSGFLCSFLAADPTEGFYLEGLGRILYASDSGISPWHEISIPNSHVPALISVPDGSIIASSQWNNDYPSFNDASTAWRSSNNGNSWAITNSIMPTCYVISGNNIIAGSQGLILRSTDSGQTWLQIDKGITNNINSIIKSSAGNLFISSPNDGVFRSTDNGNTWDQLNSGMIKPETYSLTTDNKGNIFAGSLDTIYRSSNEGLTWIALNTEFSTGTVNSLTADIQDYIYAGVSNSGIFRSTDHGNSWHVMNLGLPTKVIHALLSTKGGAVFATSDSGVFRLDSGAGIWINYSKGLTTKNILSITIDPIGRLFAGSDGSGIFRSIETFNAPYRTTGLLYADDIDFGTIRVGDTTCKNVTLTNVGTAPLILDSTFSIKDPTPFSLSPQSANILPVILKQADKITMSVCFHPSQSAVYSSEVDWGTNINHSFDGEMKPKSFLSGTAIQKSDVKTSENPLNFSIHPNPLRTKAEIDFSLEKRKYLRIECLDILGRPVKILADGNFDAGDLTLTCDLSNLADGVYVVRMISDRMEQTEDIVVYH